MPTENSPLEDKWKEIKDIWNQSPWLWVVPGLMIGLVIGFYLGVSNTTGSDNWFIQGIWPEAVSTMFAVFLIYRYDRWRDAQRETDRLKKDLLWQVRSRSNHIAISAIDRMRNEGWLKGETGLLKEMDFHPYSPPKWQGAHLAKANLKDIAFTHGDLRNANLLGAQLDYAILTWGDLSNANFHGATLRACHMALANLAGADFRAADMRSCELLGANIRGAKFIETQLVNASLTNVAAENADFRFANLYGAHLGGANLTGAFLYGADLRNVSWEMPEPVILPDGTLCKSEADFARFIEPLIAWIPPWIQENPHEDIRKMHRKRDSQLKKESESKSIDFWQFDPSRRANNNRRHNIAINVD